MWVSDLDRAIIFYRDVLGFTVDMQGDAEVLEDPVLYGLYNADPSLKIRQALFSSSVEPRGLFVMEAIGAPVIAEGAPRAVSLVIETDDLQAVEARAIANGFALGKSNDDLVPEDAAFHERVIIGPGGQAVLVFQYNAPPE